jgi:hypothetical protein
MNVKISADATSFVSGLKKATSALTGFGRITNSQLAGVNKSATNLGANFTKLGGTLKKALATAGVVASFAALKKGITDSISAYEVQATAEKKLSVIMKQRMGVTDSAVNSVKDYASALQKSGIIGDEVQLSGAQQLATFVKQKDSLTKLMPAMNNLLAQQKGINATESDAVNIGNLMGKVLQGQTSALKRVGISFDDAQESVLKYGTESEKAAMLAEVITQNVGNMNEELANTPLGKWKQMTNRLGDVKEQFGEAATNIRAIFVPALEASISRLEKLASAAVAASKAIANVFGFKTSTAATGSSVADLSDDAESTADNLDDATTAAKKLKTATAGFDELNIINISDDDEEIDVGTDTSDVVSGIEDASNQLDELEDKYTKFFENIKEKLQPIKDALDLIKSTWVSVWDETAIANLKTSLTKTFDDVLTTIGKIGTAFSNAWTKNDVGESIFTNIKDSIINIIDDIGIMASTLGTAFDSAAGEEFFYGWLVNLQGITAEISSISQAWGEAWTTVGEEYWESLLSSIGEINEAFGTVRLTIADVFNSETGVEFFETIIGLESNFNNLVGSVAKSFINAWKEGDVGKSIITGLVNIAKDLAGWISDLTGHFTDAWNEGDRGETLFHTLLELGDDIIGFVEDLTADWRDVWDDTTVTEMFEKVIDYVNTCIDNIKQLGENIFNAFKKAETGHQLFTLIKGVIDTILTILGDIFTTITDIFAGLDWEPLMDALSNLFEALGGSDGKGGVLGIINGIWDIAKPLLKALAEGFGAALQTSIKAVASAINLIADSIKKVKEWWDKISAFWDKITGAKDIDTSYSYSYGTMYSSADYGTMFSSISDVPELAEGGVMSKDAIVRVAEYSGANSNPEIVAPENKIASIINASNDGVISAINDLSNSLGNQETTTRISGNDIVVATRRIQQKIGYGNISSNFAMGGL